MRILIPCCNYQALTGMEMYVYELSRVLAGRGHDVTVAAPQVGGIIAERTIANGVDVADFRSMPLSRQFDLIHCQEAIPTEWALLNWPSVPKVATVHSQWPCERPVVTQNIYKYVCVRPEIRRKVVEVDKIPLERTTVIYNGIDFGRFNTAGTSTPDRRLVVFPGTVDTLRRAAQYDLITWSQKEDFDVLFVGKRWSDQLDKKLPANVTWMSEEQWAIEDHYRDATETAGIVLGRTTLEGWAMGKPGWIYDIDLAGNLKSVICYMPPPPDILNLFDIEYTVDQLESLYADALQSVSV